MTLVVMTPLLRLDTSPGQHQGDTLHYGQIMSDWAVTPEADT